MSTLTCHLCGTHESWGRQQKDLKVGEHCATAGCPGTLQGPNTRDLEAEMAGHRQRYDAIIKNMET